MARKRRETLYCKGVFFQSGKRVEVCSKHQEWTDDAAYLLEYGKVQIDVSGVKKRRRR